MQTLAQLASALATGRKSRGLVEECLARINDPAGEGRRVYLKVHAEQALAAADFHDRMRAGSAAPTPFAGIPISVKDLFDLAGDVTTAGSTILRDAPPAKQDAPSIARLKAAGFIVVGRSNMTEFAFSGIGINPHYDTPRNPYDRKNGRVPGGSSAGAPVSIADGMAFGAIGTDTGGSCRIPAALCGVVGYKPTAHRIPTDGAFPLSYSLDSIGPLASSVACCATLDAVMAGETPLDLPAFPLDGLRLAVPRTVVLDGLDAVIAGAFERALATIGKAGARVTDLPLREFAELAQINAKAGLSAAESYAIHRALIARGKEMYDPRVLARILRGTEQDAADYIDLVRARADFIRRVSAITAPYDALVMPTTAMTAPRIDDLKTDDTAFWRANGAMLRNPSIANFLDGCSISLPCHRAGDAPVGLMLFGKHDEDRRLLAIAAAIEKIVSPTNSA